MLGYDLFHLVCGLVVSNCIFIANEQYRSRCFSVILLFIIIVHHQKVKKRKSNCVVTRKKNRSSIFKLAIKSCNFLYLLICRLFSYCFFKQLISLCSTIFVVSFSLTGKFLPKNVKHHPKLYSSFISKVEAYAIVLQASWGYPSFQSSALVSCQWCGIPRLFGQSSHFVWYGQSP